jgi:hypothetical protein
VVSNDDGDWSANGVRVSDAGYNFGAVRLNLHAPATAVALLAAPKISIDSF